MLYLDPDHTLSVEPLRAKWLKPADYCQDRISIWRFTKYPMPFSANETKVMRDYADEYLIGTLYDVGQLLDILMNTSSITGSSTSERISRFARWGVRTLFEQLRKVLNQNGQPSFDKLFRKLDPMAPWPGGVFPQRRIPNQYGVDVEATAPAHFANGHYFDNEFELIAVYDDGWPVYPLP